MKWEGSRCTFFTAINTTSEKIIKENTLIDKIKGSIMKSFSHEVKTPLNGVIGNIDSSMMYLESMLEEEKMGNAISCPFNETDMQST
jgi:K+-sensing histidine kinase KdpD